LRQLPNATLGPGHVRLPDGRAIAFVSAGPRDGFPVVYCHGAIGSPRWRTPEIDSVIERLSIRYLVVNRPGFGGSDPSPGRVVADFARDLAQVMTMLGYKRFSVVGVSAGAPYALACGWALPERIAGLAAVSPLGPATGAGSRPSLRYNVPLAAFGMPRGGPLLAGSCLRALRLRRQTSPVAMIEDYLVCRSDWGFDPGELEIPVTLWHGRRDRLVPLAHASALAGAIPACTAVVDPAGGHFFYSRRLAEIVGSLLPGGPRALDPVAHQAPTPDTLERAA
jgi:pimeloyl-ACP methyl ester carboxylesterase